MPHSNVRKKSKKPDKPRPDFPHFPHARGYWAKKVRGKLHYFGRITDDPQGEAALQLWVDQKDALLAGRKPRIAFGDGIAVAELCDHFAVTEEQQRDAGEIQPQTFTEYLANCQIVVNLFGENRLVEDLGPEDFQGLRNWLAKRCGVHRLSKEIRLVRMIFKHGLDAGLIDKPVRLGVSRAP